MAKSIYDKKMEEIEGEIISLGNKCVDMLNNSVSSFLEHNIESAEKSIKAYKELKKEGKNIRKKCASIIALQRPVASDLRRLAYVFNIIPYFEEIGHSASKIAKITIKSTEKPHITCESLIIMSTYMTMILSDILKAYKDKDEELALTIYKREFRKKDTKTERLFNNINNEMINYMADNPNGALEASKILCVGKYLETVGSSIINIADIILYIISGEDVER